ncbi:MULTISPECIES: O-antigen polymerase [Sphingobacterium]|uniref:O-antigen polymerase n=1 Tax=Sphingobacterium TaxID=28453 RepID=UPI0013D9B3FF|nr:MULTISPECIES: O-antigen polymerase [unclassified Sphingobacterium]
MQDRLSYLLLKIIFIFILIFFSLIFEVNTSLIYVSIIFVLGINFTSLLTLRNIFICYTLLLFVFSRSFFFPNEIDLTYHGIGYFFSFMIGYTINFLVKKKRIRLKSLEYKGVSFLGLRKIRHVLLFFLTLKLLLTLYSILSIGVGSYFSGHSMADTINSYGTESSSSGLETILGSFTTSSIIAGVALYIRHCIILKVKINYYFLSIPFLIIPLISLSRNAFAFGILTLLLIYTFEHGSKFSVKLVFKGLIVFFALILVVVKIGNLREKKLSGNTSSMSALTTVYAEFSPIIAYSKIVNNLELGRFEYQFGKTIVLPILFKPIPRSFYPSKPGNTTAYYAQITDKDSFKSGFMVPPTLFGDLYLNFGIYFSFLIMMFIGTLFAYLDLKYVIGDKDFMGLYLIFFNGCYAFLRNNIPEGLMNIVFVLVMYVILKKLFLKR